MFEFFYCIGPHCKAPLSGNDLEIRPPGSGLELYQEAGVKLYRLMFSQKSLGSNES